MSKTFLDAVPSAHKHRFVTAAEIRRSNQKPAALQIENHNRDLQARVTREAQQRVAALPREMRALPANIRPHSPKDNQAPAEAWLARQGELLRDPQRLPNDQFVPIAKDEMIPLTEIEHDARKPLFGDPRDFLDAYKAGLSLWKGRGPFGGVAVLDVGGGAGTRAALRLPAYDFYQNPPYNVTAETPRSLYPILDTTPQVTFKSVLINQLRVVAAHLGVDMPILTMISSQVADEFIRYLKTSPQAASWGENHFFWNQQLLQRFDAEDPSLPLPQLYPAGHGDVATLGYEYGIYSALNSIGTQWVANSNGDEFLWYYLFPALLGKARQIKADLFMLAVANANSQLGGFFGNGLQVETPCLPASYVEEKVVPPVLNTTFTGAHLRSLLVGAEEIGEGSIYLDPKPTWIPTASGQKLINLVGSDHWMGHDFSMQVKAGKGKFAVLEASRNIFLGIKGPQHAADKVPQGFLRGYSYGAFYSLMAERAPKILNVLLKGSPTDKEKIAEILYRNGFELIGVSV